MRHSTPTEPAVPDRFAALLQFFPEGLVRQAVGATRLGGAPRTRQLPRFLVLWLLLAVGLLGRWSIAAAWRCLRRYRPDLPQPSDSALAQARQRLGVAPLAFLVQRVVRWLADPVACPDAFYHGMRLVGMDGSTLSLPDTPANAHAFGYANNQHGASGFPQIRVLALCELGTHALIRWLVKPFATSEVPMAHVLVRHLEADQLLLLDANFFSFRLWQAVRGRGAHLLARVQYGPLLHPHQRLADGSSLTTIYACTADRRHDRDGVVVRVIAYTHNDPHRTGCGRRHRLVTSLLDPVACPARELIALYHRRWEEESAFDELKTHLNDRKVDLHSRTPAGVVQETHALLLAHYLLRTLMARAATTTGATPTELSFTDTLRILLIRLPEAPPPSAGQGLAAWYDGLLQEVGRQRLRPRRNRICPRVVKGGRNKFPVKKKQHRCQKTKPFEEVIVML
jgi:hypothetical protein